MKTRMKSLEFGKRLISTLDLDPIYVLLNHLQQTWSEKELHKWLIAYWCFYNLQTASIAVNASSFWLAMKRLAASKAKRGTERRHFRGKFAENAVHRLSTRGSPTQLISSLTLQTMVNESVPVEHVISEIKSWYGFGDWIAFKAADMLEVLGVCGIAFDMGSMLMFDSPREGALMVCQEQRGKLFAREQDSIQWGVDYIQNGLRHWLAPPRFERVVGIQEVETILCKWKSHCNGKYEVGHDARELWQTISHMNQTEIGQQMIQLFNRLPQWTYWK